MKTTLSYIVWMVLGVIVAAAVWFPAYQLHKTPAYGFDENALLGLQVSLGSGAIAGLFMRFLRPFRKLTMIFIVITVLLLMGCIYSLTHPPRPCDVQAITDADCFQGEDLRVGFEILVAISAWIISMVVLGLVIIKRRSTEKIKKPISTGGVT